MSKRIEKRHTPVRACVQGGEPVDGFMCLAPRAEFHDGAESMLELLNSGKRVLPFLPEDGGDVLLLTLHNIAWVLAGPGVDPAAVIPPTYIVTREERVELCFADGRVMDGVIQMEVTEDFSRVSDFLNGEPRFYPFMARVGLMLVNKRAVSRVRLLESKRRHAPDETPQRDAA